jgi:hypothetical protein
MINAVSMVITPKNNQILQLLKEGNDQRGDNCDNSFFWIELHPMQQIFELHKIGKINKKAMVLECAN